MLTPRIPPALRYAVRRLAAKRNVSMNTLIHNLLFDECNKDRRLREYLRDAGVGRDRRKLCSKFPFSTVVQTEDSNGPANDDLRA
jgi:hypothetical protein